MNLKMLLSLFLLCTVFSTAHAWIPRPVIILQKTSENAGSGTYQIEQEVQFQNGSDVLTLKENWLIENDSNMKLHVTSARDQQNREAVNFYIQYNGGNRSANTSLIPNKKIGDEFLQKYFFIRSSEVWAQTLQRWDIASANSLLKKPGRTGKDSNGADEPYLRLSRSGGVTTYAFGQAATAANPTPGLWIEQDQFVLRKLRLNTQAEMAADKFSSYTRNLNYPRVQTVRWGNNSVTIQTISVAARTKEQAAAFASKLNSSGKTEGLQGQPAAATVEDFYKRFR